MSIDDSCGEKDKKFPIPEASKLDKKARQDECMRIQNGFKIIESNIICTIYRPGDDTKQCEYCGQILELSVGKYVGERRMKFYRCTRFKPPDGDKYNY